MKTGLLSSRSQPSTTDDSQSTASRTPSSSSSDRTGVPRYSQSELPVSAYSNASESLAQEQESISRDINTGQSEEIPTEEQQTTEAETSTEETSEGEPQESSEAESSEEGAGEESGGEESGGEEGAESQEQIETEEAEEDEESEQGEEASQDSEEGEGERGIGPAAAASSSEGSPITPLAAAIPKLARIQTPFIPSPPKAAIERREEIIKRTGSPPELNHAQVRQAAEIVTQVARDAQRQMITRIGYKARDTRISIEVMADEVWKAAQSAIAQINASINTSMTTIEQNAAGEIQHIKNEHVVQEGNVQEQRDEAVLNVYNSLKENSEKIQQAETIAEGRFEQKVPTAEGFIRAVPDEGRVGRLATKGEGGEFEEGASSGANGQAVLEASQDPQGDYHVLQEAKDFVDGFLVIEANSLAGGYSNLNRYYLARSRPHLEGHGAQQQTQLDNAAQQSAERMISPASQAQFMTMVLGLTTPVSEHHNNDQTQTLDTQTHRNDEELAGLNRADAQAVFTLRQKRDMAKEYMNLDLRENLTGNLRKQGKKAKNELMEQAVQAEIGLNSSTVLMAEDYVNLIQRLDNLLEPGKFLNAQILVPQILLARESARNMLANHELIAQIQADSTLKSMDEVKEKQIEGIGKSLDGAVKSIGQVVTRSYFDMSMFASMMTGSMSSGADACRAAARTYAEEMTKGILSTNDIVRGKAMDQIDNIAASFFNGSISGTEQAQYDALSRFVDRMQGQAEGSPNSEGGPLIKAMVDAESFVTQRANQLDDATRGPDPAVVAGGALLTYALPVVGAIATGVYLYQSDPDDDLVVTLLGDVPWPGVPAIGDMFSKQNFGNLQNTIRQKISDPQRFTALGLFSESDVVRGYSRAYGIENSTGYFDLSRDAREALGKGMSADEYDALNEFAPGRLESARKEITSELEGHEQEIALAHLENNQERAIAAQTGEALEKGQDKGAWGWIFSAEEAQHRSDRARVDAIANIDNLITQHQQRHNSFVTETDMNTSRDTMYQEFASLTDPQNRSASEFTVEQGKEALIAEATQGHNAYVLGLGINPLMPVMPTLTVDVERVEMSDDASRFIEDAVNFGASSEQAQDSRSVYEFNQAQGHSMFGLGLIDELPQSTQTRLTDAFQNQALNGLEQQLADIDRQIEAATDPDAIEDLQARRRGVQSQFDEEQTKHRQRMLRLVQRLDPEADISTPEAAEEHMAELMGDLFAKEDSVFTTPGGYSHSTYGEELITHGRASLEAGAALASEGWGTHDGLLRRTYQNRSEEEYDQARAWWSKNYGEDMDVAMGIKDREWETSDYLMFAASPAAWFANRGAETSGDLASELRTTVDNERKTDLDNMLHANVRHNEDRVRGTGFIASITMEGTQDQINLDGSRERMAKLVVEEAERRQPGSAAAYLNNPTAIFRADGKLDPAIAAITFRDGNFLGSRTLFASAARSVSDNADAYRAEIARQESILTTTISLVALVVTVAAMLIPGVNAIAAGIAVAIVSGIATMAVKAGMRGDRYGWEEAATDVAMTAIEAGSAGLGGALGKVSAFAKLGKVGGAIAREAISGAITAGAQVAIQDETWSDGFARGLENIASGALKQAAIQGVSAGVSEGISGGLTKAFSGNLDAADITRAQRAASAMGPHKTSAVTEAVSEFFGSVAGESVGLAIDHANGQFKGNFGDALKHIGMSAVRDMAVGGLRGAVNSVNKQRYQQLLQSSRSSSSVSDSQLRALRLAGISAGEVQYSQDISHMRHEVEGGRHQLARLPKALREQAMGLDADSLKTLVGVIDSGGFTPGKMRDNFILSAFDSIPGFDSRKFLKTVNDVAAGQQTGKPGDTPDAGMASSIRTRLGADLDPKFKMAMDSIDIDGLQHLSPVDIRKVAEMVASGKLNPETADALFAKVKDIDADINESNFLSTLYRAVESANQAKALDKAIKEKAYSQVMELIPKADRGMISNMPEDGIMALKRLLDARDSGTASERESLYRMAQQANPDLSRADFERTIDSGIAKAKQEYQLRQETARKEREKHLSFVPEGERRLISELPNHALIELRIQQQQGHSLSPAMQQKLIDAARQYNPDIDVEALSAALKKTVAQEAEAVSADKMAHMRSELEAGLPQGQRALTREVPILVMSDAEFEAFTRSAKGQAVTLILHGRPVVVMREGADPSVLREEGIHVLQSKDPKWAEKVGTLDESTLANWDQLPIAQQIVLYKNKLDIEIDAQQRLIKNLGMDIASATDSSVRAQLQNRLALTEASLSNLVRRSGEVNSLSEMHLLAIAAGSMQKPQWLDQPARLFNKGEAEQRNNTEPIRENISDYSREFIDEYIGEGIPKADADAVRALIKNIPLESLRVITEFSDTPEQMRKLIANFDKSDAPFERIHTLATHLRKLSGDQAKNILTQLSSTSRRPTFDKYIQGITALGALRLPDSAYRRLIGAAMGSGAHSDKLNSGNLKLVLDTVFPKEGGPNIKRSELLKLLRLNLDADGSVTRKLMQVLQQSPNARQTLSKMLDVAARLGPGYSSDLLKFIALGNNTASALKVINDLHALHKNTPVNETLANLFAMLNLTESSGVRMLDKLVNLTGRLDPQGRKALAEFIERTDQTKHAEFIESFTRLHEKVLKHIQGDLLPGQEGRLLNLIIEMASTRAQWNVFTQHAENFLTTLHALRSSNTLQNIVIKGKNGAPDKTVDGVQAILDHITKTKDPGMSDDDRKATLDQLAADITAASKQLYKQTKDADNGTLHSLADREGLLVGQVKTLESGAGVLAGKDAWKEKLANAAPNWKTMQTADSTRHFADLLKDAFPHLNNSDSQGQLALMMGLRPWFEKLAEIKGLDPKSNDTDMQQQLQALLKPLIDTGLSGRHKDIGSSARFEALSRIFKEETVRISRESKQAQDAQIKQDMTNELIKRMNFADLAELRQRPDGDILENHLNVLVERMMKYQEMDNLAGSLAGASKAGIKQNVTEVIGEIALTLKMLDTRRDMLLAAPFGKGTGFDQVWIKTDTGQLDGTILEVLVGEAKGPNASLGNPKKGAQMSLRWVAETLNEMAVSKDEDTRKLAFRLIKAASLLGGNSPPLKYTGRVVEAVEAKPTDDKSFALGHPPRYFTAEDTTQKGRGSDGYDFTNETLIKPEDIDLKNTP